MLCPFARWKPIGSHGGTMAADLGLVLHVTTNHADPWAFFSNPAHQASSHFWIGDDGTLEQYIDTNVASWAQAGGNYQYVSVETSGTPDQPLTEAQVTTLAKLYAWGHGVHGWAFQIADTPGARGFGWHGMGGSGWGGHTGCPGEPRKAQRARILSMASGGPVPEPGPPSPQPLGNGLLALGSSGGGVASLQAALNAKGATLAVDGEFGPATKNAVIAFQSAHGLTADGIVGPLTWAALRASSPTPAPISIPPSPAVNVPPFPGTCQQGSTGAATRAVQTRLAVRGWKIAVDGIFGPGTKAIVLAFQKEKGLAQDGIAGPATWNALWTTPIT